jgi:hypothetical protein
LRDAIEQCEEKFGLTEAETKLHVFRFGVEARGATRRSKRKPFEVEPEKLLIIQFNILYRSINQYRKPDTEKNRPSREFSFALWRFMLKSLISHVSGALFGGRQWIRPETINRLIVSKYSLGTHQQQLSR